MSIWHRIYLSPEAPLWITIFVIILLFLVILTINVISNIKVNRRFMKITEPLQPLSKKEQGRLVMSIFNKARQQADDAKEQRNASANESMLESFLTNIMQYMDNQSKGLVELISIASLAKSAIEQGNEFDEIVIDAKNHIRSMKSELDESSYQNMMNALNNNPEEFFSEMAQQQNLTQNSDHDSSIDSHVNESDVSDEELLLHQKIRELLKDDKYDVLHRNLNGGRGSITAPWVFEDPKKGEYIIDICDFRKIYTHFNMLRSQSSSHLDDEGQMIFDYILEQKKSRNIS